MEGEMELRPDLLGEFSKSMSRGEIKVNLP
jgi:hypothetical protein